LLEKIVEISTDGLYLCVDRGFLEISKDKEIVKRIPLADISTLLFSNFGQTVTTNLLNRLLENGTMAIFCQNGYMPFTFLWPYSPSRLHHKKIHQQMELSLPFKKNVWKQVISQKIFNQGKVLAHYLGDDDGLMTFSLNVKSGDSEGHEAQSAKRYWKKLFGENFLRSDQDNPINSFLNYGYAIIRSSVARAICSSGLYPSLGVGHDNSENAFCLVDDFIEPYRPVVDQIVYRLYFELEEEVLNTDTKKILISALN